MSCKLPCVMSCQVNSCAMSCQVTSCERETGLQRYTYSKHRKGAGLYSLDEMTIFPCFWPKRDEATERPSLDGSTNGRTDPPLQIEGNILIVINND